MQSGNFMLKYIAIKGGNNIMSLKQEEEIIELDTIKNADLLPKLSEEENIEILKSIKDGCKDEATFREKIFIGNIYLVISGRGQILLPSPALLCCIA